MTHLQPSLVVLHHGLGRLITAVVCAASAWWVLASWPPSVAGLLVATGLTGLTWALCWRPAVEVADEAVTVRNPWRDVRIPWAALDDASFGWALRLRAGDVDCRAAAAPGPASMGALYDRHVTPGGVYERDAVTAAGRRPAPALLPVLQRWSASVPIVVGQARPGADVRPAVTSRTVIVLSMLSIAVAAVLSAGGG